MLWSQWSNLSGSTAVQVSCNYILIKYFTFCYFYCDPVPLASSMSFAFGRQRTLNLPQELCTIILFNSWPLYILRLHSFCVSGKHRDSELWSWNKHATARFKLPKIGVWLFTGAYREKERGSVFRIVGRDSDIQNLLHSLGVAVVMLQPWPCCAAIPKCIRMRNNH